MIQEFEPPAWAREVVVEADAGFAANETFRVIEQRNYKFVFAVARTRKFSDGKHVADLVRHLPKHHYHRVASYKPDNRRKAYWVWSRTGKLNGVGEVTIVLSKRGHNDGPKKVKIIVTNLKGAKVGEILSIYARRWGIEVTIKELKGGLHLGQMRVTKEAERVERSAGLSVMAYLLLVKLYGRDEEVKEGFSLFKMKQRFIADVMQEQLNRSEQKWRRKLEKYRAAA